MSLPLSESAEVLQQTEREMLVRVKSFLRFYEYFYRARLKGGG